jgi:hypothetical protein
MLDAYFVWLPSTNMNKEKDTFRSKSKQLISTLCYELTYAVVALAAIRAIAATLKSTIVDHLYRQRST